MTLGDWIAVAVLTVVGVGLLVLGVWLAGRDDLAANVIGWLLFAAVGGFVAECFCAETGR